MRGGKDTSRRGRGAAAGERPTQEVNEIGPRDTRGAASVATLAIALALTGMLATAAYVVVMPEQMPPGVPPEVPPVVPPTPPSDLPDPPENFDVIDVTATYERSEETLADGTVVNFTSSALVQLDRPPQEDVAYRLQLFIRNDGPATISIEDFVLTHVTPPFAKAALVSFELSSATLASGEEATITVVLFVDAFFFDEDEDVYKLNAHHKAHVVDGNGDLNFLGMNVMFRA